MSVKAKSYKEETYWRRYEALLPAQFRVSAEHPQEEWWSWGETAVHLDRLPAPDAPLKLLSVHGIRGYGRLLLGFGAPFRPDLCEVVAPDLPGYGLTVPSGAPLRFSTWVSCLRDLIDRELRRDGRPVVLFGGSLGGMVAYHAACVAPVQGIVATTFVDMTDPETAAGISRFSRLSRFTLPLARRMPEVLGRIRVPARLLGKMQAISNDAQLVRIIAQDPCGGRTRLPLSMLKSAIETAPSLPPEQFERCPVLLVHPGVDRMTDIEFSRRFFDRLAAPKRMVVLDGAGHWPIEEPGATQMTESVRSFLEEIADRSP